MANPAPPRPAGRSPGRPCPVCGKPAPAEAPHRPFCSARCKQVDLGRWLAGDYAIPGEPVDPLAEEE
ncbi:DNA gyrase inhibitor YacG [Paracraurococcus ruber]|uniref:DNA gyrase inhibitor YacG n=1 Tax=Paracraurococcus ruber TaxID=77675 RepID=A0ABS1D6I9_9PROT|nr:DNA gyrase inhibitor YacG [Paracraurococcus ruber]MBK1661697.1 DNA gyrase inhibitor YacG [Paracraurococcus ruber]TDG17601.1 DNA gyrase inhibitor YacG [Paracraurococcus ruber]